MLEKKWKILIPAAVVIAGIVFLCTSGKKDAVFLPEEPASEIQNRVQTPVQEEENSDHGIWVHISGHVGNPGVYYLADGSRLFEAIDMAGGICEDAAGDSVNLALVLEDGQQIYIPGTDEADPVVPDSVSVRNDGRININTASSEELKNLPGIGDSKAGAIIAYREKTPFQCIEDIMNVSGIKESSFDKIKDKIKV